MSSTSSHGSMSTGSRCSLSASSRGSLSSLNQSLSNPDGLHVPNSNEHFPSSYHTVSSLCPPIYETTKFETTNPESVRLESSYAASNSFTTTNQSKGSTSSRDSVSYSSMSPPISPLHAERERGSYLTSYQGPQSRGECSQYSDTSGMERVQPCYQVRGLAVIAPRECRNK